MRIVKKTDTFERTATVQDNKVKFCHTTLHKASDNTYALTTTFDFTGASQQDILRLAAETLLIRWRTTFKNADKVDDSADNTTVNVVKMLSGSKPKMTSEQRREKMISEMTTEEKIALIARLQELQKQITGEPSEE